MVVRESPNPTYSSQVNVLNFSRLTWPWLPADFPCRYWPVNGWLDLLQYWAVQQGYLMKWPFIVVPPIENYNSMFVCVCVCYLKCLSLYFSGLSLYPASRDGFSSTVTASNWTSSWEIRQTVRQNKMYRLIYTHSHRYTHTHTFTCTDTIICCV